MGYTASSGRLCHSFTPSSTLLVTVVYILVSNQQQQSQQFVYGGPAQ